MAAPRPADESIKSLLDKTAESPAAAAPPRARLGAAIAGLFVFYVAHDALQERAFRSPGFRFGWFMSLVEIGVVSLAAIAFEFEVPAERGGTGGGARVYVGALAVALAASQGTGSAALNYVSYPYKVAFKSSKLVPAMAFGILVHGTRFSLLEYGAAGLVCCALAGLGLADARSGAASENAPLGCALLTVAVVADALVPNLQEKVLRELRYPVGAMIAYSNGLCFCLVFAYTLATGELFEALSWCKANAAPAAFLMVQASCSYAGLRCYLVVVKHSGGVAGVVVTSLRKVLTLTLSFLLFAKPFTPAHAMSFGALGGGVALAAYARTRRPPPPPKSPPGN